MRRQGSNRARKTQMRKEKEENCFFNDTATTEIYTLSLHDALPISQIQKTISTVTDSTLLCIIKSRTSIMTANSEDMESAHFSLRLI